MKVEGLKKNNKVYNSIHKKLNVSLPNLMAAHPIYLVED